MFSSNEIRLEQFDDQVKNESISFESYLGRLRLRTHNEIEDTSSLAQIFSNPLNMQYLQMLQPPNGFRNVNDRQWTKEDFLHRVQIQNQNRSNGKSCVFNVILFSCLSPPNCNEYEEKCIGTTGFVRIDDRKGFLGILLDHCYWGKGYASEALYSSIQFAFQRLGVEEILIQTNENNRPMRNWCEKLAQIDLDCRTEMEMNGFHFIEYQYRFNYQQWINSIQQRLENKLNSIRSTSLQ